MLYRLGPRCSTGKLDRKVFITGFHDAVHTKAAVMMVPIPASSASYASEWYRVTFSDGRCQSPSADGGDQGLSSDEHIHQDPSMLAHPGPLACLPVWVWPALQIHVLASRTHSFQAGSPS